MAERENILLIGDIISSINNVLSFTEGFTPSQYLADIKTRHAVERNFEIIGEAASRISEAYKNEHAQIEWRILKDFRNFIIHEYFGIDDLIVWDTIQFQLPDLLLQMKNLVSPSTSN